MHLLGYAADGFPVYGPECPGDPTDGTNKLDPSVGGVPWVVNQFYIIPLCQSDPGNVGWLDWTPTAGGTSGGRSSQP